MESPESDPPCIICGSTKFTIALRAADFDTGNESWCLSACERCGLTRTTPWPSSEAIESCYGADYYGSVQRKFRKFVENRTAAAARRQAGAMLRAARLHDPDMPDTPSVLDIGCGRGLVLRALAESGCTCVGLERPGFPAAGAPAGVTMLRENFLDCTFGAERYNLIILRHVLEHLDRPDATLVRARDLLADGGLIWIEVPNLGSVQAQLFKSAWFHLDLPRHLYHFTPATLRALLSKSGLQIGNVNTFSLDQSVFGFVQSALNASGIFGWNSLYRSLKFRPQAPDGRMLPVQLAAAAVLGPFALMDFALSGLLGRGSCITALAARPD